MIQDKEPPSEKEPAEAEEPRDDCGTGGDGPPDASDPPKWDHIDDGATCPDPPEN